MPSVPRLPTIGTLLLPGTRHRAKRYRSFPAPGILTSDECGVRLDAGAITRLLQQMGVRPDRPTGDKSQRSTCVHVATLQTSPRSFSVKVPRKCQRLHRILHGYVTSGLSGNAPVVP